MSCRTACSAQYLLSVKQQHTAEDVGRSSSGTILAVEGDSQRTTVPFLARRRAVSAPALFSTCYETFRIIPDGADGAPDGDARGPGAGMS